MRKRILLVQGWLGRNQSFFPFPIGLAAVAVSLADRHDVRGFDPNVVPDPLGELAGVVSDFAPDVVGVSLRNVDSTNYFDPCLFVPPFLEMVRVIRRQAPGAVIIAGGAGFSLFPVQIMRDAPEIDFGVHLEGDRTMAELIEGLDAPEGVPGILYRREGGEPVFSEKRPLDDFRDDWPMPAWDIFDLAPYRSMPFAMGVETKRGCAFRCAYCCYYVLNGPRYRLKPPERVVEEVRELYRRGFRQIHFTDSVFNHPLDHAMAILTGIRDEMPDMTWDAYLSPLGITDAFVELSLSMGLGFFVCSPDTCGDAALAAMGKEMRMADLRRAVEVIRRHPPARFAANFFVNGPDFSWGTLWAILTFALWAKWRLGRRYGILPLIKSTYIRIEPGTRIEKIARKEGVIAPENDLYPKTVEGFRSMFYRNRGLRWFNAAYMPFKLFLRRLYVLVFRKGRNI